jgi:hypothetical protein
MPTLEQAIKKHRTILAEYNPSGCEEEDYEFLYEDFLYEVKSMMKRMGIKKFFAYGVSLTWRNVAGYTEFETESASTLVSKLTPNSDYTIQFLATANRCIVEVIINHHDKPMGEIMWLMSQKEAKRQNILGKHF